MAEHLRAQIRHAMVELLKDRNAQVGDRVHTGRARPLPKDDLPAADADFGRYTGRPDGGAIQSDASADPTRLLRRLPVMTVDVTVRHADGYLDALDEIWLDYEPAIANDNTLGGLVARMSPVGEPLIVISTEGDLPVARAMMTFEVEYVTAFNAPGEAA